MTGIAVFLIPGFMQEGVYLSELTEAMGLPMAKVSVTGEETAGKGLCELEAATKTLGKIRSFIEEAAGE